MAHLERVTEVTRQDSDRVVSDREVSGNVFVARLVYFIFGVIIAIIALRIVLLLLAANQGSPFVDFVYGFSGLFVAPFNGIFGYTPVYGASVLEVSSIVAIIIYALISWGIVTLITLTSRDKTEV